MAGMKASQQGIQGGTEEHDVVTVHDCIKTAMDSPSRSQITVAMVAFVSTFDVADKITKNQKGAHSLPFDWRLGRS